MVAVRKLTDEEKEARFQKKREVYLRQPKINILDPMSFSQNQNDWQRNVYRKVLLAIPDWYKWPRDLRQVYVMLPSHGCGDDGVEAIAETLKVSAEKLKERIQKNESFSAALDNYRRTGKYPDAFYRNAASEVKHSELVWVLTAEAALVSGIVVERELTAAGAMKLMERMGNLDTIPKTNRERRKKTDNTGLDIFGGN